MVKYLREEKTKGKKRFYQSLRSFQNDMGANYWDYFGSGILFFAVNKNNDPATGSSENKTVKF